jgi:hypothetical protein
MAHFKNNHHLLNYQDGSHGMPKHVGGEFLHLLVHFPVQVRLISRLRQAQEVLK